MSEPVLTAVVPYRDAGDADRARNLATVLAWLSSMPIQVLLSEQSERPSALVPPGIAHVWSASSAPFSKATACNEGVLAARSPVVALVDADTMVRSRSLLTSAQLIRLAASAQPVAAIRPFGQLVDLDRYQTARVHDTGELPGEGVDPGDMSRRSEHIPLAGGILVIERSAYLDVGGMDETFSGWGGEDDAFSRVLERCEVPSRKLTSETAYHLWHSRHGEERYGHPDYASNFARAQWWRNCPDPEFTAAIQHARDRLCDRDVDTP